LGPNAPPREHYIYPKRIGIERGNHEGKKASEQKWRGRSVSRILSPLRQVGVGDGHSSSPDVAIGIQQPTRGLISPRGANAALRMWRRASRRAGTALSSYLALHHAGFAVPRALPRERWALTPPFHPYRRGQQDSQKVCLSLVIEAHAGGLFSVALSVAA